MPVNDKKSFKSLDVPGFPSLTRAEFTKFKAAIGATTKYYMQEEKIFRYSKLGISNMAYVSEGSVILQTTDEKGKVISSEIFKKCRNGMKKAPKRGLFSHITLRRARTAPASISRFRTSLLPCGVA